MSRKADIDDDNFAGRVHAAYAAAFVAAVAHDLLSIPGGSGRNLTPTALLVSASLAAMYALAVMVPIGAAMALVRRVLHSGGGPARWIATMLVVSLPVLMMLDASAGPGIAGAAKGLVLRGVAVVMLVGACYFGVGMLTPIGSRRRGGSFLCLAAALAALAADARLFVDRYPMAHVLALWCGLSGAAVAPVAARLSLPARRSLAVGWCLLCGLGLFGTLSDHPAFPASSIRSTHLGRTSSYVVRRFVTMPQERAGGDASAFERLVPPARPIDPAELDRLLPDRRRFNVLFVSIDTVRADHCGFMGYERPITPAWDRLAAESFVFRSAYAQYPSSQLSMASMFTGLYPLATGVHRLRDSANKLDVTPDDRTLALALSETGRETVACTSFSRRFIDTAFRHLPVGFARFHDEGIDAMLDAGTVTRRAIETADRLPDRPWFMWVHYFDPHSPYERREPPRFGERAVDLYDEEIARTDDAMATLLDHLRKRPDWERTIVLVHSDHGEEFLEHGGRYHHSSLYEEQMHVPLTVRVPGLVGRVVDDVVELVDLPATLLDLLGERDRLNSHGESLAAHMVPDARADQIPASFALMNFRERHVVDSRLDAARLDGWKIVHNLNARSFELYDLRADPGEKHDLASARPEELRHLEEVLGAAVRRALRSPDASASSIPTGDLAEDSTGVASVDRLLAAGDRDGARRQIKDSLARASSDEVVEYLRRLAVVAEDSDESIVLERLDSPEPRVRIAAAGLARSICTPSLLAALERHRDEVDEVRFAMTIARAWLGDATVTAELERATVTGRNATRIEATMALVAAGHAGVFELVANALDAGTLTSETESAAIAALARSGRPHALAVFARRYAEWRVRPLATKSLLEACARARAQDGAALARLLLDHHDAPVRRRAATIVEGWGRGEWIDVMRRVAELLEPTRELGRDAATSASRAVALKTASELTRTAGFCDFVSLLELEELDPSALLDARSEMAGLSPELAKAIEWALKAGSGGPRPVWVPSILASDGATRIGRTFSVVAAFTPVVSASSDHAAATSEFTLALSGRDGPEITALRWHPPRFIDPTADHRVWLQVTVPEVVGDTGEVRLSTSGSGGAELREARAKVRLLAVDD